MTVVAGARRRLAGELALGAAAGAVLAVLYAPALRALVAVWWNVPYFSYGFLVPLFSAYVVWERRALLTAAPLARDRAGFVLAGVGFGVLVVAAAVGSLTLAALSIPVVLAGFARWALGRRHCRVVRFPLAFLALMAPLPPAAIPAISLPLQRLAAATAGAVLPWLGVPVVHHDLFLHLPRITLEVTEACNGLRFLLAMIVLGVALAWAVQRSAAWRATIVALAVVLAIVANLVRVTGTGVLAYYVGSAAAQGMDHIVFGKVVYLVMLVPLVVTVAALRRRPVPDADERPAPATNVAAGR